jgi:transcription elongation factor Elf1
MKANVILCKCPHSKGIFGIRIEQRNTDWVRTWAFKVDSDKAKREGFDKTKITSSMPVDDKYPGCPYCGSMEIAQCGCGKLFCWHSKAEKETLQKRAVCPWCGQEGDYSTVEKLEFSGGDL